LILETAKQVKLGVIYIEIQQNKNKISAKFISKLYDIGHLSLPYHMT